jgi:hypothetical protein
MQAYWDDVRLLFRRVKGVKPVVVHVEPDLWGHLEQAGETTLARAFAQQWIRLRNALAPNVLLAYHMSGWARSTTSSTRIRPTRRWRAYAAQSAAFYRSLGARFDVAFED